MEKVLINGINYLLDPSNQTASVCQLDNNEKYEGDIVIPSSISHNGILYSVTSIGGGFIGGAFEGCTGLTSIEIPNSITSIEDGAFKGCTGFPTQNGIRYADTYLIEVVDKTQPSYLIKEGTRFLGNSAFSGCTGLTSIEIPNSVTSIGRAAFSSCTGLTSIKIPNSVTSIESESFWGGVFEGCTGLTSIAIPNSVTSIGGSAFQGCTSLTSIKIPNSVTSIGECAFYGCTSLTSLAIPNSVTSIGGSAFLGCTSLTSVAIPNSVTSIGCAAFKGCTVLNSIEIPNSVTSIESFAFECCASLTSITIPNGVTNIGEMTFYGCIGLTSIIIPNSITSIGEGAFFGCTNLISVTINSNTIVGMERNCNTFLESVFGNQVTEYMIGNNVTSVGNCAFSGCYNLTSITIPNSVMSIGDCAFKDCWDLTSITIPCSVTSIGEEAFAGCPNLISIVVEGDNTIYDSRNNCNAVIETATNTLIQGCKTTTIPNSVTSIGNYAFSRCDSLTSVTIPNSVTVIGDWAFFGCGGWNEFEVYGLTTITIPNSVTSIGNRAFEDCHNLQTIRIPQGKKSIFCEEDRQALQNIIIEYTEALIGDTQYELDDNLTAKVCAKADKYAGDIVLPTCVEQDGNAYTIDRIAQGAFRDCYDLTSVTLPKTITEIGEDIFSGCENLQTICVPQGMTEAFCKMGLEPWRDKIVEPRQEEYTILLNIARGYELGIGMARNLAQAVLCYVQAADKGCAEAAYHLGELYEEGKALPQDYQQAADWFAKASQLYHPNGEARRQVCLCRIEEENARLSAFQEEQHAARQAQLAQWTTVQKPQKTILFFDTETNGLPANYKLGVTATANWPRLIQLGWIISDESGNVLKRKSQLIYPQSFTIDADVTRLTGITTAAAQRNGIALSDVLSEFMADVESASLLVGHNVDFDMHIVGCELYRMGMNYSTFINKPSVCTMVRSTNFCAIPSTSRYYSGYKFPSLTELYTKLFGHAFSGAHDALSDITATKDCYFELRRRGIV